MKVQSLSILLVFLSLVGCALQPHAQEPMEADTQKKTHEDPAKPACQRLFIAQEHDSYFSRD